MSAQVCRWFGKRYPFFLLASGVLFGIGVYIVANQRNDLNKRPGNTPAQPANSAPSRFRLVDLGTLGGSSSASAINNQGQVVGTSDKPGISSGLIFLWENGRMQEIGTLIGKTASTAGNINNNGHIAGSAHKGGEPNLDPPRALIYRNGKVEPLFADGRESDAVGINDQEQVVGEMTVNKNIHHAFLWSNGTITDLGTLQGGNSSASAINAVGQVVGYSDTGQNNLHAFLWKEGRMYDLGTLGGKTSEATAINDKGQVVGTSETEADNGQGPPQSKAFLWEKGIMHALNSPGTGVCYARSINNQGQVVGDWIPRRRGFESARALLWEDGKIYDLNDLIPINSGWILTGATDINDQGQIVGIGTYQGGDRAFLLIPE